MNELQNKIIEIIEEASEENIYIEKWTERIGYIIDSKDKKSDLIRIYWIGQ